MSKSSEFERVGRIAEFLKERAGEAPRLALVLGSGLGDFGDQLEDAVVLPYGEVPDYPTSSVPGHAGRLVVGAINGVRVAVMQGRVHGYEGYTPQEVVRPLRSLITWGVKGVLVTNAAGGFHPSFHAGDLMLITDHLNLTGLNPLTGPMPDAWPCRFIDMAHAYDPKLTALVENVGRHQGLELVRGVYAGVVGASYETPAEIRLFQTIGADAVGMSTVHEVIAARHLGARVMGISCITNLASGLSEGPLTHGEVQETADRVKEHFSALLVGAIPLLHEALGA